MLCGGVGMKGPRDLYRLLGRRVECEKGRGVLVQVFGDRATVVLTPRRKRGDRVVFCDPATVCEVSESGRDATWAS